MAVPTFALTVSADSDTRRALSSSFLYVLKVVHATAAGQPLVWYRTNLSLPSLTLQWQQSHAAYAAPPMDLAPGAMVFPAETIAIDVGMSWDVDANSTERTGGTRVINVLTSGHDANTVGLSQPIGTAPGAPAAPYCAFQLFPTIQIALEPVEQVVLTFSTGSYAPGAVLGSSNAPSSRFAPVVQPDQPDTSTQSVVIDMTNSTGNARSVSYSVMSGWSCAKEAWASVIAASEPIAPYAIQPPIN